MCKKYTNNLEKIKIRFTFAYSLHEKINYDIKFRSKFQAIRR